MHEIDKLINDLEIIKSRGIDLTMDGFIAILKNAKDKIVTSEPNTTASNDILLDFLLYLYDKELINNHDFDYEEEITKFLNL